MSDDKAISVKNVTKDFYLPHEKSSKSLKSTIINVYRKKNNELTTQHALKGVSFDIPKGEFFGILGRNGSGKSTLLKMLAGIYQPTTGSIETNGKLVPFIELGVGFNPELSGRENVYLNGALLGFTRKEIDLMYQDIVEFAELEKFMDQKLKNYSSGMQVRLAFSVATRAKADILLIDEVLAVGDADFQKKCYDYFKGLKKTGATVVFVTHDMSAVREYCDRAILIEKGHITHEGKATDVANEYLKLFMPDQDPKKAKKGITRFGTGEVKLENIKHIYTEEKLNISFDVVNMTDSTKEGLNLGFDFYTDDLLITGNGTKYIKGYEKGFILAPNEMKHFVVEFPNNFGNFDIELTMHVRNQGGLNICDEIKPAVKFRSNNTHLVRFFKVTLPMSVTEN